MTARSMRFPTEQDDPLRPDAVASNRRTPKRWEALAAGPRRDTHAGWSRGGLEHAIESGISVAKATVASRPLLKESLPD
jgi:hypothetical protein